MNREDIPGWATFTWIYDEWLATNPRKGAVVVEVGVALGKTISYIADKLIEAGRTDVELWAVDPWAGTERNGEQQRMAGDYEGDFTLYCSMMWNNDPKAFEFVRPIRATSERASRMFDFHSVDLVTIDGDHSFEACSLDIEVWLPRLTDTGWIGGDDYHNIDRCGVERAVCEKFGTEHEVRQPTRPNEPPTWLWRM